MSHQTARNNRIVITGMGMCSAIGVGREETLASLREGRCGISAPVRYLKTSRTEFPVGEVPLTTQQMIDMTGVEADRGEMIGRNALVGRVALREALATAGMLTAEAARGEGDFTDIPFISGTTVAGMDRGEVQLDEPTKEGMMQAIQKARTDCGFDTEEVARCVGKFKMMDTLSTACSSAANAIIMAAGLIETGLVTRVVAGGTESLSRLHMNGFASLIILDQQVCRPFAEDRAGLNLGEGAAYLVLETEESALARGAKPLAVLSGYGNACDAFHQTATSAEGEGAYLAITQALAKAGLQPSDIDYINAHGTGTPNNDATELVAMHRVFGETLPIFSSTKRLTGHTTSASGSLEACFCIMALAERGYKHVLCNAFGFGGNDSALVISAVSDSSNSRLASNSRPIYIVAHKELGADDEIDYKQYIKPVEARRMCKLMKRTLALSLDICKNADNGEGGTGVIPDGIITGTMWGNIESCAQFWSELAQNGEGATSPTAFMLSTNNTLSSLIAINTKNHGYNATHSQGEKSLEMAMLDAWLVLQRGMAETILVGVHDALPEFRNEVFILSTKECYSSCPSYKPSF